MIEEISNKTLFDFKLNALKHFSENHHKEKIDHAISCNYHGIELHFKLKSSRLSDSLKGLIPSDWLITPSSRTTIYLFTPEEFNLSSQDWCAEVSQDCITFENNSIAIQRDFAAQIVGPNVYLICDDQVGDGFYNFLRWYLSERLMSINKFVVHASCVLDKLQRAHLFLGHSGAGKTTITRLSMPRSVLGDDMNLVSLRDKSLYVEAGAIGGLFNSMIGYENKMPVEAVYWLKQSDINFKQRLDPMIANQKLLASFANLHWPTMSEEKIDQLISFSSEVVKVTSFFELQFKNDSSIWEYLDP